MVKIRKKANEESVQWGGQPLEAASRTHTHVPTKYATILLTLWAVYRSFRSGRRLWLKLWVGIKQCRYDWGLVNVTITLNRRIYWALRIMAVMTPRDWFLFYVDIRIPITSSQQKIAGTELIAGQTGPSLLLTKNRRTRFTAVQWTAGQQRFWARKVTIK